MSAKVVLIVEDNIPIRDTIEDILKAEMECEVFGTLDGETALLVLQEITPELFLVDYKLADKMSGIDLIYHIRSIVIYENTPIILMSAYLPLNCPNISNLRFLSKPFDLDTLLRLVEESFL